MDLLDVLLLIMEVLLLNTSENIINIIMTYFNMFNRLHKGRIVSVAITTNGNRMYSSSSSGLLVMYDSTHSIYPTLKTLGK